MTLIFTCLYVQAQSGQKWATGGNNIGSDQFLGSTNNAPLIFKTNNSEHLRLTSNGYFGIGTSTPGYSLDVAGNFHLNGPAWMDSSLQVRSLAVLYEIDALNIRLQALAGSGQKLLMADSSGNILPFNFSGSSTDVLYGDGRWDALPVQTQLQQWWQHDSNHLHALNMGNVGIGTAHPLYKLDVTGDIRSTGSVWAVNLYAAEAVNIGGFTFKNGAGGGTRDSISAANPVNIRAENIIGLDADTVTIRNRVGIGKNSPAAALDVYGDVIASGSIYTDHLYAAGSINIGGFKFSKDTVSQIRDSISNTNAVAITAFHSIDLLADTVYMADNVGIGTRIPKEKLSVAGNVRVDGKLITNRIVSSDSLIYMGDSSLVFFPNANNFWADNGQGGFKGVGIGFYARGLGAHSFAAGYSSYAPFPKSVSIGSNLVANQAGAIVIGEGLANSVLRNNCASSLMVGFRSDVPTLFVGPADGNTGAVGKVGIGTNQPRDWLQVGSGHNSVIIAPLLNSGAEIGWCSAYLGFNVSKKDAGWELFSDASNMGAWSNGGGVIMQNNSSGIMSFIPVSNNANLSQNQFLTDEQLFGKRLMELYPIDENTSMGLVKINGGVMAKEVKITLVNWWSDYVFDDDYSLMPLGELQDFIAVNRHLPGVPSEDIVKEQGINAAEMDAILLKKIEELTLYILELKQEIELLKNNNGKP